MKGLGAGADLHLGGQGLVEAVPPGWIGREAEEGLAASGTQGGGTGEQAVPQGVEGVARAFTPGAVNLL